jgi:hypothetical protein
MKKYCDGKKTEISNKNIIMGNQKDLQGTEAIEKMRKLIESEDICLFATRL